MIVRDTVKEDAGSWGREGLVLEAFKLGSSNNESNLTEKNKRTKHGYKAQVQK